MISDTHKIIYAHVPPRVAPQVVIVTTYGATCDDKIGIMKTSVRWNLGVAMVPLRQSVMKSLTLELAS